MASIYTNATLPCNSFKSLTNFFAAAQRGEFNITSQIQRCPDLCGLAWGVGNPDLSGIGATISWIYQATITVIFGPFVSIVWCYAPRRFRSRFKDLHRQFFYATALVVLPVLIATIVYLRQGAALYEVTYLYYLSTMQFLALLSVSVSGAVTLNRLPKKEIVDGAVIDPFKDRGSSKPYFGKILLLLHPKYRSSQNEREDIEINVPKFVSWVDYAIAVVLACFVGFGLYMGCLRWIRRSSISMANFQLLTSACQAYGSVVPSVPEAPGPVGPAHFSEHVYATVSTTLKVALGVSLPALALVVFCFALYCVYDLLFLILKCIYFLLIGPKLNFLVSLAFTIGMLYCLAKMQEKRHIIKKLSGPDFQDDKWGFGQVLAVFVWIPLSLNVIRWIIMLLINRMMPKTSDLLDPEKPTYFLNSKLKTRVSEALVESEVQQSPLQMETPEEVNQPTNAGEDVGYIKQTSLEEAKRESLSLNAEQGQEGLLVEKDVARTRQMTLHLAIREGNIKEASLLIENGADVNSKDEDGRTVVGLAARGGHETVVKQLVEKGVDVNSKDEDGQTALQWALEQGHTAVAKWLVENGSDVNSKDKDGRTTIGLAAAQGYIEVVRLLVENGADVNSKDEDRRTTALHWALEKGQKEVVNWLVENGAELLGDWKNKEERTTLHLAAMHGYMEVVELLVEKHDLNLRDNKGWTALHLAARAGHEAVVRLLVEKRADITLQGERGWTAETMADEWGYKEIAKFLKSC